MTSSVHTPLVVLLLLGTLLSAAPASGEEKDEGWISIAAYPPRTLDPALVTGVDEERIASGIFEGLVRLDPDALEPVPGVATSWTVDDDGRRYVFRIRDDARFADGTRVTAHHFVDAWLRCLDAETGCEYAYLFDPIRGAREHRSAETPEAGEVLGLGRRRGFWASDPKTLHLELRTLTPWFPALLASPLFAPIRRPRVVAEPDAWWRSPDAGNGAFRIERLGDDEVRLVRSETYWDREGVGAQGLRFVLDDGTPEGVSARRFRDGDLDWVPSARVPAELAAELEPAARRRARFISYFYRVNVSRPPLDDVRVRRALALAVDRSAVAPVGQLPSPVLVPPETAGRREPETLVDTTGDLERARRLLAEAGFGRRDDAGQLVGFRPITILYNTFETHQRVAEAVAEAWRALGIPVEPVNAEWQSYAERVNDGDYDVARAGWIGDYDDPLAFLGMWTTEHESNRTRWSDARYDALIAGAVDVHQVHDAASPLRREPRVAPLLALPPPGRPGRMAALQRIRRELLVLAESRLLSEVPVIPLFQYEGADLVSDRLRGLRFEIRGPDGKTRPNVRGVHPLSALSIAK